MGGGGGKEPGPLVQIPLLDSRVQAHWKEALPRRKQGDPPRLQESGYCLPAVGLCTLRPQSS